MLFQVIAPHFVAGLELDLNNLVVRTAPIVHYMKGWSKEKVIRYCELKGWEWYDYDDNSFN